MPDTLPSAEKFRHALHFDEIYRHHVRDIRLVWPAIKSIARLAPNPDFAWINVHDPESGTTYALTNEHIHSTPYSGSAEATTTILPLDLTRLDVGGDPDGVEQSSLDVEMHVRHHPEVIAVHARGDFAHPKHVAALKELLPALRDAVRVESEVGAEQ